MLQRRLTERVVSIAKLLSEVKTPGISDQTIKAIDSSWLSGSTFSTLNQRFISTMAPNALLSSSGPLASGLGQGLPHLGRHATAPMLSLRDLHSGIAFAAGIPRSTNYQSNYRTHFSPYSRYIATSLPAHLGPTSSSSKDHPSSSAQDEGEVLYPPEPLSVGRSSAAKQKRELRAVNVAVGVNVAIFLAKVGTWVFTRSGALLAEALHSLADIVNQLLLRAGVQQSRRPATMQHPYGFHREKYIYALMSAVGVFCIGAGASVVHGIQALWDPPALDHMGYSLAVLGVSAVAEMYSLRVAFDALRTGAKEQGQPIWKYLMSSNDPTTAAVLAEDAGAVAGLGIAGVASYLTYVTGDPVYDALGSIAVGCLMGAVAVTLIRNNKKFLIGQAMRPEMVEAIITHLKADPMVLCVIDPKSEEIGDGVYRFKAEIQWSGDRIVNKYLGSLGRDSLYGQIRSAACTSPGVPSDTLENAMDMAMMEFGRGVIRTVGEEIDRLEAELIKLCPGLAYVDLETDRGRAETSALECLISGDEDTFKQYQQYQQRKKAEKKAAATKTWCSPEKDEPQGGAAAAAGAA